MTGRSRVVGSIGDLEGKLERYEYGKLAQTLKDSPDYANIALGLVDRSYMDSADEEIFDKYLSSKEGVETASLIYSKAYDKAHSSATVGELGNYYSSLIEDIVGDEDRESLETELDKFSDETLGDINKKVAKALYILQGAKKGLYDASEDELRSAISTSKKYETVVQMIQTLENIKLGRLEPRIAEIVARKNLEGLAKKVRENGQPAPALARAA